MSMLDESFFVRNTLVVARELAGKVLVRRMRGVEQRYTIVEVEAYDGPRDRASHASRGKTPRTAVMFGRAGRWYVYLIYGMYEMLNIVTGPVDYPAAVLIRGVVDQQTGIHIDGPGKLTRVLKITRSFNTKKAMRATGLWIEDGGVSCCVVMRTPRIGVQYAGPLWSQKPYRFILKPYADTKRRI